MSMMIKPDFTFSEVINNVDNNSSKGGTGSYNYKSIFRLFI